MYYSVLIARGQSKAEDLADALTTTTTKPASVYVVGLADAEAFASALIDGNIEVDTELDAQMALRFEWVHAIGTEDGSVGSLMLLVSAAKNLADEINAHGSGHTSYFKRFAVRK